MPPRTGPVVVETADDREPDIGVAPSNDQVRAALKVGQLAVEPIEDLVASRVAQDVPRGLRENPEERRVAIADQTSSPEAASCSAAYSRMVSSISRRFSWLTDRARMRLRSTSARTGRARRRPARRWRPGPRSAPRGPRRRRNAEAPEERALGSVEQVVAPVDRPAERPLAVRQVSPRAREQGQPRSSRARIWSGARTFMRAAASSSASGRPSSRRQIAATAAHSRRSARNPVGRSRALHEQVTAS